MLFKIGGQFLEKEAYDRAMNARNEHSEIYNESNNDIDLLREQYLEKYGKEVATSMKNNKNWIISKL